MCKLASFFIHQLHLIILLLLNVSVTQIVASDRPFTNHKTNHQADVSTQNASFTTNTIASSTNTTRTVEERTARSTVNDDSPRSSFPIHKFVNSTNIPKLLNQTSNMRTNLDHLNELNKNNLIYTDQYVVQLNGGPELAKELAEKHNFVYLGQVRFIFLSFLNSIFHLDNSLII